MAASMLHENATSALSTFSNYQVSQNTIMYEEFPNTSVYTDITVVKALNKAKFPVYLVNSNVNNRRYAMKVFPFSSSNNKPHAYFRNEARFSFLSHPYIIKTHHVEQERQTQSKGTIKSVSYTVMEYAPYGDFFDFVMNKGKQINDMMIRTYFRQLIDGVEYLHNSNVSHMDLKLENLLLGENFNLKIADFDLSYIANDPKILSRGTKFYRPPEVIQGKCVNTQAADIYSVGIILFTLVTGGILPHAEDSKVAGVDFAALLYCKNDEFWSQHCKLQKKDDSLFDQDFKDLFNAMVRINPDERVTIDQIKQSNWYNGPYYTNEELTAQVGNLFTH